MHPSDMPFTYACTQWIGIGVFHATYGIGYGPMGCSTLPSLQANGRASTSPILCAISSITGIAGAAVSTVLRATHCVMPVQTVDCGLGGGAY